MSLSPNTEERARLVDALETNTNTVQELNTKVQELITEGDARGVYHATRQLVAAETRLHLNKNLLKW